MELLLLLWWQAESDEAHVICQNLESILSYLRAALSLLNRVEQAVDRFLFWDEEVRICEEVVQVSGVHIRK